MAMLRLSVGLSHHRLAAILGTAPCTILAWEHQTDGPRHNRQADLDKRLQAMLLELLESGADP
jgi:DNA-binding transcriptional regulator YiaG